MESSTARFLVLEGSVIIASILIAFGIQAWWEESQEDEEAERILESVLREHRSNLKAIERWERSESLFDEAITELAAAAADGGVGAPEQGRLDELLSRTLFYGGPDLSFGSLEPLVAGGRLALIDDVALRESLARWHGFQAYYENFEKTEVQYLDSHFVPFLAQEASLLQIVRQGRHPEYDLGVLQTVPVGEPVDHRELLRNREFLGHLTWRYLYRQDYRLANSQFNETARDFDGRVASALGVAP